MINIPKIIFILGFGVTIAGSVLLGERLSDSDIKCLKSFKRRVKYYILPIFIMIIGFIIIGLAIGSVFIL